MFDDITYVIREDGSLTLASVEPQPVINEVEMEDNSTECPLNWLWQL
jgi:hypothetical protein